jgi:hypothetical protein
VEIFLRKLAKRRFFVDFDGGKLRTHAVTPRFRRNPARGAHFLFRLGSRRGKIFLKILDGECFRKHSKMTAHFAFWSGGKPPITPTPEIRRNDENRR